MKRSHRRDPNLRARGGRIERRGDLYIRGPGNPAARTAILYVGTVVDVLYESVGLFGWSAGFEWELVKNLRLIGEYTDRHTREEVPDLDEPAFPRDTAFAALDLIVPLARQEL